MRIMAGRTLPPGKRGVGILIFFGKVFVALGTGILEIFLPQKAWAGRTMGIMTGKTLAIANRLVGLILVVAFADIAMTAETKRSHFCLNKPFVLGDMGIMTEFAFAFGNRRMDHRLHKTLTVMAAETKLVLSSHGRSCRCTQHD